MALTEGGLWLFAGCNGAGKSTFIEAATRPGGEIEGVSILNPDRLTKELLQAEGFEDYASVPDEVYRRCFISAAERMKTAAVQQLQAGMPVCIETVLSTPKYLPLVDVAVEAGLPFNLVYVTLRTPLLACQRVATTARSTICPCLPSEPRISGSMTIRIQPARDHGWSPKAPGRDTSSPQTTRRGLQRDSA